MTLTNYAYLEIDQGADPNAVFELNLGLEYQSTLQKSYIMGSRGQYIREIVNQTPGTGEFDTSRRTGFWLDGGAGDWQPQLAFETGIEDVVWGDAQSATGPANVTKTDASGAEVKAVSRLQVLQYWLAKTRSDSLSHVKLHHGEWTDGNIAHVTGVSAGAFGEPMPVAITEVNLNGPPPQGDNVFSMEGTIQMSHVAIMSEAPAWVSTTIQAVQDAAADITDA